MPPVTSIVALLLLSAAAVHFMTPAERVRLLRRIIGVARRVFGAATESSSSSGPFEEWLSARTGWPVVTPAVIALNIVVFTLMLFDRGAGDTTGALIAWGANVAPRTASGEWWRLVSTSFVHGGLLHLLATLVGLLPAGLVLERAVGRVAFGSVYVASGIVASVVSMWAIPATEAGIGASGAICGVYGLLLATLFWGLLGQPRVPVPAIMARRIAAAAGVFVLYNLATGYLTTSSELAGLGTGLVGGLLFARGVTREKPAVGRVAMTAAAAIVIAVAAAVPLRGIVDARPEIARVAEVEERTTAAYDAAVAKFRRGTLPAKGLVQLIERTIIPELRADRARVQALRGVAREQQPLVAAAGEYFELREQSWRRRAEGLTKSNMRTLREADRAEQAALEAYKKMMPR